MQFEKYDSVVETCYGTEPRGETVDAVDKVDSIGDKDYQDYG